jgi:hypothetical protein
MDHSGPVQLLPSGEIYYEGTEAKSAHTGNHTLFGVNSISYSRRTLATRKKHSADRRGITYRIRQEGCILHSDLRPQSRNYGGLSAFQILHVSNGMNPYTDFIPTRQAVTYKIKQKAPSTALRSQYDRYVLRVQSANQHS